MIVAHADDEILWGGAHLLADDYYVVCVSSGDKPGRVESNLRMPWLQLEINALCLILLYTIKRKR